MKDSDTFRINLDCDENISLNNLFSNLEVIPLETNQESLIHRIHSILEFDHHFYILDRRENAVLIFNNVGKFVKRVLKKGRGPGEYNCLDAIRINRYTGNLELIDAFGKFLICDRMGNYISEIKLPSPPFSYNNFENLNQDTIVFYTPSYDSKANVLRLFSRSTNTIIAEFCKEITPPVYFEDLFKIINDTLFYYRALDNHVYYIQNDKLEISYKWDFGKDNFKITDELLVTSNDMEKLIDLGEKTPYFFQSRMKFSRYAYASLFKDTSKIINIFYDIKKTNNLAFIKTVEGVALNPCLVSDSCFVATVLPAEIPKYLNEKILSAPQLELLKKVSEEDNPIIVKYHFKESL